jgi:polysaccharide deacetylase 2 family uncharacterized protein YibQ
MDTLDEDEIDRFIAARPVGVDEAPPRKPFPWRGLLMVLVVLALGGGLGTVGYFVSNMEERDVIGMLDVADKPSALSMQLPGRDGGNKPDGGEGEPPLLSPPGGAVRPQPKSVPTEPPPSALEPAAPVKAETTKPATPSPVIAEPPKPGAAPKTEVKAGPAPAPPPPMTPAAPQMPAKVAAIPAQPTPLAADQAPTYDSLPMPVDKPVALAPAPVETLLRVGPNGPLPVISTDGKSAWKTYARPFDAPPDKARLAVVVVGLGLDREATDTAIAKLPPGVTLVFSPYAGSLDKWIKKARDAGHEVMMDLPVETSGFPARDPGPLGLLVTTPPEEVVARLERVLAKGPGAVGVWAADGPFTQSKQVGLVLTALKDRGLLYIGTAPADGEAKPPMLGVVSHLDAQPFRNAIEARQIQAQAAIKEMGRGIVAVHARPVAFDRLVGWLGRLPDQNIALAPVSAVVR